MKPIFTIALILYLGVISIWLCAFPISYKLANTDPDIVETRSMTTKEYEGLNKAYLIRRQLSKILIYSSVAIAVSSFFLLRRGLFRPVIIIKVALTVSLLIAIILLLADSVHFIPTGPIR